MKVAPLPSPSDSARTVPPCEVTISLTISGPRPVPCTLRVVCLEPEATHRGGVGQRQRAIESRIGNEDGFDPLGHNPAIIAL